MGKKGSLSTLLFALSMLLFLCATFAMFGAVVKYNDAAFPNMFEIAFGTSGADDIRVVGGTAVFAFQMIILACIVAIIYGTITRKFHYIVTMILYGIICLSSFIAFIISFNLLSLYGKGHLLSVDATLGPGPIAYSVLHIVGLVSTLVGLFFSRRNA